MAEKTGECVKDFMYCFSLGYTFARWGPRRGRGGLPCVDLEVPVPCSVDFAGQLDGMVSGAIPGIPPLAKVSICMLSPLRPFRRKFRQHRRLEDDGRLGCWVRLQHLLSPGFAPRTQHACARITPASQPITRTPASQGVVCLGSNSDCQSGKVSLHSMFFTQISL